MSDLNTWNNAKGKLLFGILLVIVLIAAGIILSVLPNQVVSAEKLGIPATGSNPASHYQKLYLRPQVVEPANEIHDFGGGYLLVVKPDGSAYMLTPYMAANEGD